MFVCPSRGGCAPPLLSCAPLPLRGRAVSVGVGLSVLLPGCLSGAVLALGVLPWLVLVSSPSSCGGPSRAAFGAPLSLLPRVAGAFGWWWGAPPLSSAPCFSGCGLCPWGIACLSCWSSVCRSGRLTAFLSVCLSVFLLLRGRAVSLGGVLPSVCLCVCLLSPCAFCRFRFGSLDPPWRVPRFLALSARRLSCAAFGAALVGARVGFALGCGGPSGGRPVPRPAFCPLILRGRVLPLGAACLAVPLVASLYVWLPVSLLLWGRPVPWGLPVRLSAFLSAWLSVCLSGRLSVWLCVWWSAAVLPLPSAPLAPSGGRAVPVGGCLCLSVCLAVCPYVAVHLFLFVC